MFCFKFLVKVLLFSLFTNIFLAQKYMATLGFKWIHWITHNSLQNNVMTANFVICIIFIVIYLISFILDSGAGFRKPPLERTSFSKRRSFLVLWEAHLKTQFPKASFKSPYQRSSLKLKEGANVL